MVTRRHPTLPTNRLTTTPLRQSVLSTSNDSLRQSASGVRTCKTSVHKDREVSQYRTQAQQHEALAGAVINELRQAWVDAGFSEDDVRLRMDAIHGRTHSAMQQIAQASQSAESEYRAWAQGSAQRMANFVRQFSVDDDGNQLFDPNTDTVLHDLSAVFRCCRAITQPRPQQRTAAEQQFYAIHSQHQAHVLSRREQALLGANAAAPEATFGPAPEAGA